MATIRSTLHFSAQTLEAEKDVLKDVECPICLEGFGEMPYQEAQYHLNYSIARINGARLRNPFQRIDQSARLSHRAVHHIAPEANKHHMHLDCLLNTSVQRPRGELECPLCREKIKDVFSNELGRFIDGQAVKADSKLVKLGLNIDHLDLHAQALQRDLMNQIRARAQGPVVEPAPLFERALQPSPYANLVNIAQISLFIIGVLSTFLISVDVTKHLISSHEYFNTCYESFPVSWGQENLSREFAGRLQLQVMNFCESFSSVRRSEGIFSLWLKMFTFATPRLVFSWATLSGLSAILDGRQSRQIRSLHTHTMFSVTGYITVFCMIFYPLLYAYALGANNNLSFSSNMLHFFTSSYFLGMLSGCAAVYAARRAQTV